MRWWVQMAAAPTSLICAPAMAAGSSTLLNLDSYEVVNRQIRHSPQQQKRRLASVAALSLVLVIVTVSCLSGQRNAATALAESANSDEAVINSIEDRLDTLEVADHRLKKKLARLQDAFDKFSPVPGPRGLPGQDGSFALFCACPLPSRSLPPSCPRS